MILLNRRGYPGAVPFEDQENPSGTLKELESFMEQRAQEIHGFLETFIVNEKISPRSVTIVGWSFGSIFITALLGCAQSFQTKLSTGVASYIRQAVLYGSYNVSLHCPCRVIFSHLCITYFSLLQTLD